MDLAPHADAGELRRASLWLEDNGAKYDIPAEHLMRLDLCLNEALANVIDHGGHTAQTFPIRLRFDISQQSDANEATVTVMDAGAAFDPVAFAPKPRSRSLDEVEPGGLGITMMRNFSDELRYQYRDGYNQLAFTVRWKPVPPPPAVVAGLAVPQVQPFGHRPDRRQLGQAATVERRQSEGDRRGRGLDWMDLFQGEDETAIRKVIGACDVLTLPAGTALLQPGEANDCIYLLLSGKLATYLDSGADLDAAIPIERGECIGELSVIDGKPVSALVVAVTDVRVLKLTQDLFWDRLMMLPGVARNMLTTISRRMRLANEAVLAHQRKQLDLLHLRKELETARELQASMLPLRRPMFPDRDEIEIAGLMEAASEVGGDLFDAFFVDDHHLFFCIGDVSGHGIPAAMFMARVVGLMRIVAMGTLRPDELIMRINDQLCVGNESSLFVTLFCGFLNVSSGRLVYTNGGHCAPVLFRGKHATRLPLPKGPLVGAIPDVNYGAHETVLAPGDTLVCFTDGVTEAKAASGEEFSEERLIEVLQRGAEQSPEAMMDMVRQEVTGFTGQQALDDDYTLLTLRMLHDRRYAKLAAAKEQ